MIQFFRKIRQKMLTENKFSKYLIYAIGEIILVVIGILIAFQLNVLNEERKIKATAKIYYTQLLVDLEKDKNYIERITSLFDSNIVKLNTYKKTFKQPNLSTTQIIQSTAMLDWTFKIIQFQSNTISTLQNTGDIKLLKATIRNTLIDYNKKQEIVTEISRANNQMGVDNISYTSTRYLGSPDFIDRIINQPKILEYILEENRKIQIIIALEASLHAKEVSERATMDSFKEMLVNIDKIKKLIHKELEE